MQYQFFADKQDKINLLDYIFKETDLLIFDSYSVYEQEIREFKNTGEIITAFDLEKEIIALKLWSPSFKAQYKFRKIDLNPKSCKGFHFRYCIEGWGLIQLLLEGITIDQLKHSTISHNSEKRALAWENTRNEIGKVSEWNWKTINSCSGKLKYHIHQKMSVRKENGSGILEGADKLEKKGIILR